MLEFRTQGFNGYSVKYSPFFDSRLAVAASANFGLVGKGRLFVLGLTPKGIVTERWFDTQDSLFDVSWSEAHENQLVAACGDGSVKLFDIGVGADGPAGPAGFPVQSWHEHAREVFAVHWNLVVKDRFCSSSWDGSIKLWSPERAASVQTLPTNSCTYSAAWSPHSPSVLSAVSSDSHLRIFDLRAPRSSAAPGAAQLQAAIPIHAAADDPGAAAFPPSEALTHDWNKYRDTVLATAGVDRLIRTWDLRAPQRPVAVLAGHEYAVRKIAWSPHLPDLLLSASYDMTCRVWTDGAAAEEPLAAAAAKNVPRELGRMGRHSEFVTGVDWCLFGAEGWCASCGWDERVLVWDVRAIIGR